MAATGAVDGACILISLLPWGTPPNEDLHGRNKPIEVVVGDDHVDMTDLAHQAFRDQFRAPVRDSVWHQDEARIARVGSPGIRVLVVVDITHQAAAKGVNERLRL